MGMLTLSSQTASPTATLGNRIDGALGSHYKYVLMFLCSLEQLSSSAEELVCKTESKPFIFFFPAVPYICLNHYLS